MYSPNLTDCCNAIDPQQEVVNAKIRVFLNCVDKHSEMPQKSYFRMVMDPELKFDPDGRLSSGPTARFSNLPAEVILTMHHHIPDNWGAIQ